MVARKAMEVEDVETKELGPMMRFVKIRGNINWLQESAKKNELKTKNKRVL